MIMISLSVHVMVCLVIFCSLTYPVVLAACYIDSLTVSLVCVLSSVRSVDKKFELMLTRRVKVYRSSGSVVQLKIGVFTLS